MHMTQDYCNCLLKKNHAWVCLTFLKTGENIYGEHNLIDGYEMMRLFRQMSDSPWTFFLQEK